VVVDKSQRRALVDETSFADADAENSDDFSSACRARVLA
jgi:hypothetical protein